MKYLRSEAGTIIECEEPRYSKLIAKGYFEITEYDAHLLLFDKISHRLGAKFANYNQCDIASEVYLFMLTKYQADGDFAKDKTFADNGRIWWSVATKRAYWIIREYNRFRKHHVLYDEIPEDSMMEDTFEIEHTANVDAITAYIYALANSKKSSEQQLGLFGIAKLNGLNDAQVCDILEVGMPRLFEIKRALKLRIRNFIGENL